MRKSEERLKKWGEEAWVKLLPKLRAECERTGEKIPFIPVHGRYQDLIMPGGICWWTNGFWPGILWQAYHASSEECFKKAAMSADARLFKALDHPEKLDHDIGFMFLLSAFAQDIMTKDEEARAVWIQAADLLAARFHKAGSYIRAWNKTPFADDAEGLAIIDCMMNLSLLFRTSEVTGNEKYAEIAKKHADTTAEFLVREDGSCAHIAQFDPATGTFLKTLGGQGYGEGSSWSRGQGWCLYGFSAAYRHTGDSRYLDIAKRSANYCIAALNASDLLPLADFRAPEEPVKLDSNAGAIIACGLIDLASGVPEFEKRMYEDAAWKILTYLEEHFVNTNPDVDGVLNEGRTMYHDDRLAHLPIIVGDYFYTEAVIRTMLQEPAVW